MTENGSKRETKLRSKRPIYLVYTIVDDEGIPQHNAKISIDICTRDANVALRSVTENKSEFLSLDLS